MAQLPAKAAPNTSAPIRIAALTTVIVFCQLMLVLLRPEPVFSAMKSMYPLRIAGQSPRKGPRNQVWICAEKAPFCLSITALQAQTGPAMNKAAPSRRLPQIRSWRTGRRARSRRRPSSGSSPEQFLPAFETALAAHQAEIAAVTANPAQPDFANTIEALERAGRTLGRVSDVFFALAGANTGDAIEAIERDMSPKLAAHFSRIYLDTALFGRVDALFRARGSARPHPRAGPGAGALSPAFRRAGAHLDDAARARLGAISERLATLGTSFSQNVIADERDYTLELNGEADLAGLPEFVRAAARNAAEERDMPGKAVVTLSRSSVEPFLQFSSRRDLREKVFRAFIARGDGNGAADNKAIIAEIVKLRAERAKLLGYETFAKYRLDDSMAKTPQAVRGLLDQVWTRARARAFDERDALQKLVQDEGGNFPLAPVGLALLRRETAQAPARCR